MRFKYNRDRRDWAEQPIPCDKNANAKLKALAHWIDDFCKLVGLSGVTITSYYRPGDPKDHGKLQALDIRLHDKPPQFVAICRFLEQCLTAIDPNFQIYTHPELIGKPDQHIHIAYRTKKK